MPKAFSNYLWGKLSMEFIAGATSATIFLYEYGIEINSVFNQYEIWALMNQGIDRIIQFIF